jgi:hypothetical protein
VGAHSFIGKKNSGTLSMTSDDLKISYILVLQIIHIEIKTGGIKTIKTSILPEF